MRIVSLYANNKQEASLALDYLGAAKTVKPLEALWKFLTFQLSGAWYDLAGDKLVVFLRTYQTADLN